MTTALQILIIVTLIGILAGLAVTRYGRGWFGTRASGFTAALVGIAGAFLERCTASPPSRCARGDIIFGAQNLLGRGDFRQPRAG